jgi:hypothetical protein
VVGELGDALQYRLEQRVVRAGTAVQGDARRAFGHVRAGRDQMAAVDIEVQGDVADSHTHAPTMSDERVISSTRRVRLKRQMTKARARIRLL